MSDPIDLGPIRGLHASLSGTWCPKRFGQLLRYGHKHEGPWDDCVLHGYDEACEIPRQSDSEPIVALLASVPALLAEVERLRARETKLRAMVEGAYREGFGTGGSRSGIDHALADVFADLGLIDDLASVEWEQSDIRRDLEGLA